MKVYEVNLSGMKGYVCQNLKELMALVEAEAEDLDEGWQLELKTLEMSQEKYSSLPEFAGW